MDKLLAFLILNDTKKGVIDSVVLKLVIVYFLFLFLATLKQILTEILHVWVLARNHFSDLCQIWIVRLLFEELNCCLFLLVH